MNPSEIEKNGLPYGVKTFEDWCATFDGYRMKGLLCLFTNTLMLLKVSLPNTN